MMNRKMIIKNNTKCLTDVTVLNKVYQFLVEMDIPKQSNCNIITFADYVCLFQKLKSGTLSFTFFDKEQVNGTENK